MIDSKYFGKIVIILMVAAVLLTTYFMLYPDRFTAPAAEPEYVSKVFDKDEVTQIDIQIDQEDFDWLLENATAEEYRAADITVNGETFYNVGIRPKGNSSLRAVAMDDTTDRYSFKLEFDAFVDGQTCFGLDKIALNNMYMDKTYMKEYLAYDMFASMGVVTPLYSFASITVNGEPWGLYLAVEAMEESFAERNWGSTYGNLYKPEGTGSDLKWTGEDESNYSGIRDGAVFKVTDSDFDKVVEMIEHLNSGTGMENYLDVDAILRYFAVNTVLVNFDSYAGNFKHNYYLYEEDGVFTILPWDLNQSFAGFGISSGEQAVHYPIDMPVTTDLSERPLIGKLLEVPEYKELYHKYIGEVVTNYFDSGIFEENIQKIDNLINNYVKNDATAFFTYEQYQNALPVLLEFGKQRAASITAQLAGERSSTTWEESDSAAGSGDEVSIDLNAIGGQMGGGPGGPGAPAGGDNNRQGNVPGRENAGQGNNEAMFLNGDVQQAPGGAAGINDRQGADGGPEIDGQVEGNMPLSPGNGAAEEGGPLPPGNEAAEVGGAPLPPGNGAVEGGGLLPPGPDNAAGGNLGQEMPDRENMTKAMEIIQEAGDQELTVEQMEQLEALGFDEAMIERMRTMPDRFGGDGGPGGRDMNQGQLDGSNAGVRLTSEHLQIIAASAALVVIGLIFAAKFKRRKYSG